MKSWFPTLFGALRDAWSLKKPGGRTSQGRFRPTLDLLEDRVQPSVSLGAAGTFAVLGVNGGRINFEGGVSIDGDVGLGPRETGTFKNADVAGNLIAHSSARLRLGRNFEFDGFLRQSLTQANADANAASTAFAGLAPTQTLGRVTRSLTITGNGDVNVINVNAFNYTNRTLTLSGGASDQFVINVTRGFSFHRSQVKLVGGVTADHVVFNFSSRSGVVDISGKTSNFNGTVLAPWRSVDVQNAGTLSGAIIAKNVNIHARANVTFVGFTAPAPQQVPATLSGHANFSGAVITLRDSGGAIVQQVGTDTNGFYQFTNIAPGTYSLSASKSDYRVVDTSAGTDNGTPNGTAGTTKITNIVLAFGDVAINYEFELEQTESSNS